MTKSQYRKAYTKSLQAKAAKRAESLVVSEYPGDHNPYIVHERLGSCYSGCRIAGELAPGSIVYPDGSKQDL